MRSHLQDVLFQVCVCERERMRRSVFKKLCQTHYAHQRPLPLPQHMQGRRTAKLSVFSIYRSWDQPSGPPPLETLSAPRPRLKSEKKMQCNVQLSTSPSWRRLRAFLSVSCQRDFLVDDLLGLLARRRFLFPILHRGQTSVKRPGTLSPSLTLGTW